MAITEIYVDPAVNADSGDGMNDDVRANLSNATYDHTGNGEGERHLSLAGGFSSYTFTAGDRIYLKNAAGGVAEGSYEVASKVDDDAILLVADAGLTADSTADVDSSTGAYGDLRYAIEQTTFDTTNGTRFNIKSGTAEILTENLHTSTQDTGTSIAYSTSTSAQLFFEGYTSTQGDGGIGEIDGNATYPIFDSVSFANTNFKNLRLHNTGANYVLYLGTCTIDNCEIYDSTSGYGLRSSFAIFIVNCYFHDLSGDGALSIGNDSYALNCRIDATTDGASSCVSVFNAAVLERCTIIQRGTGHGVNIGASNGVIKNCSIYNAGSPATNTNGISSTQQAVVCINNLVEGWDNTGCVGVKCTPTSNNFNSIVGGNAVYDCTTAFNYGNNRIDLGDDETLSASPFVDAANGDFTPVDVDNVKEGALPVDIGLTT